MGRRKEIARLAPLLARHRLITLTGAGGSGKSRLARRLGAVVSERFADGVWLVELAALSDPSLVEPALCSVLGIRRERGRASWELLVGRLDGRRALLVLDNCEHLIEGCAELVDALLHACSGLRVLATSREALRVDGERVWMVPPLAVSRPEDARSPADLLGSEAARLFVQRAEAAASGFAATDQDAPAIAELCERLEGMPLAIELAAARTETLLVPEIVRRLRDPLAVLTRGARTAPRRHQTLRATLEWSYRLLGESERWLIDRLSVFSGGWTIEAAEAVGSGAGIAAESVLDLLGGLVGKSLVQVDPGAVGGGVRYTMLEPLRQFTGEQLERGEDLERVRERHARYYLGLVEQPIPNGHATWMAVLATERANIRAALGWFLDSADEQRCASGLRMATLLARNLYWAGSVTEGRGWLERGLAATRTPTPMRVQAMIQLGLSIAYHDNYSEALETLRQATAVAERLDDPGSIALSLAALGIVALHDGHEEQVRATATTAQRLRERLSDRLGLAYLLRFLSMVAVAEGRLEVAEEHVQTSLRLSRELDDPFCTFMGLATLAAITLERGEYDRATECHREIVSRSARASTVSYGLAFGFRGLALAAGRDGDLMRAARLWGAATALSEEFGVTLSSFDRVHPNYEGRFAQYGALAERAALAEGQAMTVQHAVEYALTDPKPKPAGPVPGDRGEALTTREREVLVRVTEGLTNIEIATTLGISPATVERHLATIYRKIGARSRTEAAVYALTNGIVPPPAP